MSEELFFVDSGDEQLIAGERLWHDFSKSLNDWQCEGVRRVLSIFDYEEALQAYYAERAEEQVEPSNDLLWG